MKSSTIIGFVIVIAVLAVAGFFAFRPSSSNQALAPTPGALQPTTQPSVSPLVGEEESGVLPETSASPSVSPLTPTAAIEITDTGFVPSTLIVKAGTAVRFVNNGQGLHWPASDPHPTHGGLPGFDAKQALATGESYSFTFTKVGTFGFHDHLHSNFKGSLTVQ